MSDFDCCTPACVNCYGEDADLECVFLDVDGQIVDEWPEHDFRTSHDATDRENGSSDD